MNGFIILIMAFSTMVRMVAITKPLLGNFSSYQTVWAMMARFMEQEGFRDLLNVKVNVLVNGQPGLHLLSYPLASLVAAILHTLGGGSLDFWGRFQAILFSVSSIPFFYHLVRRLGGDSVAKVSTFVYAFSPLNVIYGQSFMNEACALFFLLSGLYTLVAALAKEKTMLFILSGGLMGIAIFSRLHMGHLYLPIGYLFWKRFGIRFPFNRKFIFYFLPSLILPLAWYGYAHWASLRYDHIYYDLSMQQNFVKRGLTENLLSPVFYQNLFDNVGQLIFTPVGLGFFILGLFSSKNFPERRLLGFWLASVFVYFIPLSDKVMHENFFTLPLVPVGAIYAGIGFEAATKGVAKAAGLRPVFACLFLLFSLRAFFNPLRAVPEEDKNLLPVALEVQQIVPPEAILVAARGSAPDLLYYSNRNGWPFYLAQKQDFRPQYVIGKWNQINPDRRLLMDEAKGDAGKWLEFLRKEGADYFVASNAEEFLREKAFADYVEGRYLKVATKTPFVLFDLNKTAEGASVS